MPPENSANPLDLDTGGNDTMPPAASRREEVFDPTQFWTRYLTRAARGIGRDNLEFNLFALQREYPHKRSLYIDYETVQNMGSQGLRVADDILEYPAHVIRDIKMALTATYQFGDGEVSTTEFVQHLNIRFANLGNHQTLVRDIRSNHVRHLVCVEGIVRKTSGKVFQRAISVTFLCQNGHPTTVRQTDTILEQPDRCSTQGCTSKRFKMVPERSEFVDCLQVRIQESPEGVMDSSPQSIDGFVFDDLAGEIHVGDRVRVVAIVRAPLKRVGTALSTSSNFELEILSIDHAQRAFEEVNLSDEDLAEIEALSRNPDLKPMLIQSFAQHIHGNDDIKLAILLQMFGAPRRPLPNGAWIRGDTHILLIGDPGTGKSEMIRDAVRLSPRGMFTSGQSTSGAGLTVTATKDDFGDGRWTVESGLLVLADRGLAGIDEVEKIDKSEISKIHEAMEQQTISFSKVGISMVLECRTSILAGANPKLGKFDAIIPIGEQIAHGPSFLSRFDLIFIMNDLAIREQDEAIVHQIFESNRIGTELARLSASTSPSRRAEIAAQIEGAAPPIPSEMLRKYIAYAKRLIPEMTPEAQNALEQYYLPLRSLAHDAKNKPMPVTARSINALIRLADAHARLRLSETVEIQDAAEAVRLTDLCLRQVAYDAQTGLYDMGRLVTGMSSEDRTIYTTVLRMIREVSGGENSTNRETVVQAVVHATGATRDKVEDRIEKMIRDGTLAPYRQRLQIVGDQQG